MTNLQLREITREIITTLEKKSGYIVDVKEDPNLATLANYSRCAGQSPCAYPDISSGGKKRITRFCHLLAMRHGFTDV